jgi:opacity protein-like surface antigen
MSRAPILISVLFFLAAPSFALDLSTGYGLITGASFDTLSADINNGASTSIQRYNQFHFGASVFFDADYIAANINFYGTATAFSYNSELMRDTYVGGNFNLIGTNLALGLRFKYPFNVVGIKIFPLLGIQGNLGLSQTFSKDSGFETGKKNDSYGDAGNWSVLAFEAGGGVDIDITDNIFFRANAVMNYKLNSRLDETFIKAVKDSGKSSVQNLNMGFEVNFLVGYKLGEILGGSSSQRQQSAPERLPPSDDDDDIFYPK